MNEQTIICPSCRKEIPLTEEISHQIREKLQKEFDAEVKKKEKEIGRKEQALMQREKAIREEVSQKMTLERGRGRGCKHKLIPACLNPYSMERGTSE